VGVHVARRLSAQQDALPPTVEVLDAGTALFDVLGEMSRYCRVILVDAMRGDGPAGSIYRLDHGSGLADESGHGTATSLHQWGVVETLRAARALGLEPPDLTVFGIEPATLAPGTELSPEVERAARRIVSILFEELGVGPDPPSLP
jgi:hydrogenase maturation protease